MVSPARLVDTISKATGVPLPTLIDIDRRLVKADFRAKAGRGRHVARMTARDAACLLIAVLGAAQSNQAADAVDRYERTRPDRARSSDGLYAASEIAELTRLPAGHSFVQAVETLIGSVSSGGLGDLAAHHARPRIELYAFTGPARGHVRLSGLPNGMTASIEYAATTSDMPAGDLAQSRRVTDTTLWAIGELWSGDDERS